MKLQCIQFAEISYILDTYYSLSVPNLIAISWYSSLVLAISSGHPRVANCDAATLEANVSPANKFKDLF